MNEIGTRNPACGIDTAGLTTSGTVHYNLAAAALTEQAIRRGEARLTAHGALVADTGQHTGRSPKDKFIVRDAATDVDGLVGQQQGRCRRRISTRCSPISARTAPTSDLFVQDLIGGADRSHSLPTRVVTEFAWHSLFIRNLLIRPDASELDALRAGDDDHRPAVVPRRSGAPRHADRNGDRRRPHPHDRADRRHRLCRRDEEGGVHRAQLPAAAKAASCRCIARPMSGRPATRPCSSACRAPARRRCRPIRRAR